MMSSTRLLLALIASLLVLGPGCKRSHPDVPAGDRTTAVTEDALSDVRILSQGGSDVSGSASWATLEFSAGGARRTAQVYIPAGNDGARSLLILFHGLGDSAENFAQSLNAPQLAEKLGVIVAVPQGLKNPGDGPASWNAGACCAFGDEQRDDVALLPALQKAISTLTEFNREITDVAGFSNGGFFAEYLACKHTDLVRGILNVGGNQPVPDEECVLSGAVNVVRVHGTADDRVPFEGGEWRGTQLPSLNENFVAWRSRIGCSRAPIASNVGAAACRQQFDCPLGNLEVCSVHELGHSWPTVRGTGLDVFDVAWQVWNRPAAN